MSLSAFFNPSDGLTVCAQIDGETTTINGYFDILDESYFVDDSHEHVRAEFVCMTEKAPRSLVGKQLVIDGVNYRVNSRKADATGVSTLSLIAKEL